MSRAYQDRAQAPALMSSREVLPRQFPSRTCSSISPRSSESLRRPGPHPRSARARRKSLRPRSAPAFAVARAASAFFLRSLRSSLPAGACSMMNLSISVASAIFDAEAARPMVRVPGATFAPVFSPAISESASGAQKEHVPQLPGVFGRRNSSI